MAHNLTDFKPETWLSKELGGQIIEPEVSRMWPRLRINMGAVEPDKIAYLLLYLKKCVALSFGVSP